jgi:CBS domain-containing protein
VSATLRQALSLLLEQGARRVLVTDDGAVVGAVGVGEISAALRDAEQPAAAGRG